MNFDEPHALAYGTKQGAGWRLDCLGDMRGVRNFGAGCSTLSPGDRSHRHTKRLAAQSRLARNLRNALQLEEGRLRRELHPRPGSALAHHLAQRKVLADPRRMADASSTTSRRRWATASSFAVSNIPESVKAGTMMPVNMWWLNAGVAPIYRDYALAVELRSSTGSAIIRVPAS